MSILNRDTTKHEVKIECVESSFTCNDFKMLSDPERAYLLPLAVIGLIDMNAFFAQCEQVRLGKSIDEPVVCCQWKSLIAVSYAARKYGVSRLDPLSLALKKCPLLVIGHAAVFKKGESYWRYLDGLPSQALHKVSLDPYRRELRKVFRTLQSQCDLVEKASVDECYLDFGRAVHNKMLELFPELRDLEDNDRLPPLPQKLPDEVHWEGVLFHTEDERQQNTASASAHAPNPTDGASIPNVTTILRDWDDITQIIGSKFLYDARRKVYDDLKYTTSGGLATTKTIAKLAAGFIKPDSQVIVRQRAINPFLNSFELTDITSMGGMIGQDIVRRLQVPPGVNSISYIRKEFTLDQLKEEFRNDHPLATRIYEFCQGKHQQKLKQRTEVKSMMSRKNFLADCPVKTVGDAYDWIKVFVGDLYGRLVELDYESLNLSMLQTNPNGKASISRPKTVTVHFTTSAWEKMSKQCKFPVIRDLVKFRKTLEVVYFKLLCQILENNKASDSDVKYLELSPDDPCLFQLPIPLLANLAVVISNFSKTADANLIDSYGQNAPEDSLNRETIKRQFEELNSDAPKAPELAPVKKITRSNSYVRKLFEDFEKEKEQMKETTPPKSNIAEKPKSTFKEDKDYVKKMFEDYQHDEMVRKAISEISSPVRPENIRSSDEKKKENSMLLSKSASPEPNDAIWKELMLTKTCPDCKIQVEDVFEHRDFHVALELSSKLNGGPTGRSKAKNKNIKGQSILPF